MSAATDFRSWRRVAGGYYILTADLMWEIGKAGSGLWVIIPAGFVFDSSVPRLLRWLVPQSHEPWLLAAAVHDYLLDAGFDRAFAAGEWCRAARAKAASLAKDGRPDWRSALIVPAYFGIGLWTVPENPPR